MKPWEKYSQGPSAQQPWMKYQTQEPAKESVFPNPPTGQTYLSQERPLRRDASKIYTPALKMGGLLVGSVKGGPAGGGLGYAIGGSAARRIDEMTGLNKPQTAMGATGSAVKDFSTGATMEMGGRVLGRVVEGSASGVEKLSRTIRKGIEKGIKPSTAGKKTHVQYEQYLNRAENAVGAIIKNKANLKLTNEFGDPARGLPQNLKQFSQAIDQTKKEIFNKYDSMQMAAGARGSEIRFEKVLKELDKISNSKTTNNMVPEVAKYAGDLAKRLKESGPYTAKEAQEAISILNNKLESFYKNPTYENASTAYIDSMVANNLRKSLDSVIMKTSGRGYQELKNTYGALKTIERDVTKRAIVDARKNIKGLIDFSDVYSGSEVMHGILTMNPARVGAGATAKTIAGIIKYKNNPNRMVKSMFGNAEKILAK